MPRAVAMSMVGHKTESIYRRYAIVDAESLREAASKIDATVTLAVTLAEKTPSEATPDELRRAAAGR